MMKSILIGAFLFAPGMAAAQSSPYSPVIEANGVLYVAGHLGFEPGSRKISDELTEQTRQALENIGATLATVNSDHSDIVRCQVFMTDMSGFQTMNAAYRKFFPENPPARTTIGVASLPAPAAMIEIECTAVRGYGQKMEK